MLQLLREVEQISGCRDRDILAANVVATVHQVFSPRAARLLRIVQAGPACLCEIVAQADADGVKVAPPITAAPAQCEAASALLREAVGDNAPRWRINPDGSRSAAFPIPEMTPSTPLLLEIDTIAAADEEAREALERFVRIYANFIGLLDYSERDTLTGLLNRKTFDEAFDRLLQHAPGSPAAPDEERRASAETAARRWIGVVDIDHFKRVNDGFGHLFGDEVLLRVANLMKSTFRQSDRLFRFGGEEFVVMLQPTTGTCAKMVFDRFRAAVERHEFPQIGQVTCSIGYTAVETALAPTDILGRADQALYFGKENGRNQINDFEDLLACGAILHSAAVAAQPAFDIDALFA